MKFSFIRLSAAEQSRNNSPDNVTMDVSQTTLNPIVVVGQLFVIDSHEVQYRGVEIVPVNGILDRFPSGLVGLSVAETTLDPTAGQPACEAVFIVIPSWTNLISIGLGKRSAAKFCGK